MDALKDINLDLPPDVTVYQGKVRNVYTLSDKLVTVATDRISAFDHILPKAIPFKGQVLNQIAAYFLEAVQDIVPVWLTGSTHPNVSAGRRCQPVRLEMVIRGYLSGHAWREYKAGMRSICGIEMPEGMHENDPFPEPIITPTSKAEIGHDIDISEAEILSNEIVTADEWQQLVAYTRALFQRGSEMALQKGLILVDTKYEFGIYDGEIMLMDEIHTPDSSRYFYLTPYAENQALGRKQEQLSKEFVREWLISKHFQGLEGQVMPDLPDAFVTEVSQRYINLYTYITGREFQPVNYETIIPDITGAVKAGLGL